METKKRESYKYWSDFYKKYSFKKQSSFAEFCLSHIKGEMIELGCGDCRDLNYFKKKGIKCFGIDLAYNNTDVETIVDNPTLNKCPEYVYARFFWHAIDRKLQLKILKWVKSVIFIEARTTEDKPRDVYGVPHKRNLVDVPQLAKDLKDNGFQITYLKEGRGLSKFKGEDPHLVWLMAKKNLS